MSRALRRWGSRALPPLPPSPPGIRWALAVVVAIGVILRVAWAVRMQPPVVLRDPMQYMTLADHLARGDGYRYGFGPGEGLTAYYPPGYPLALGAVVWLVRLLPGDVSTFDVAVWSNVVLSTATIGMMFVLGRRLVGPRVGLLAAAVWAVWPNIVFHSGVVLTETLFLFLLVAILIVALGDEEAARAPGVARVAAVGVLFGAVLLVRPVSVVIAPVLLVLWWPGGFRAPALRSAAWRLGVAVLATLAVLVPWSIRSTVAMDAPVLLSLNLGDNLCLGHNPGATGGFNDIAAYCYTAEGLQRPEAETRRNSENIRRAVRYAVDNPGTTLRRTPAKLRITLENDWDGLQAAEDYGALPLFSDARRGQLRATATAFYVVAGLVALAGAVLWLRRRAPGDRRPLFLVVAGLAQLLSPVATFGDARFKVPIYPTVAVCAAVAMAVLWDRLAPAPQPLDRLGSTGASRPVPRGPRDSVAAMSSAAPSS